tara:strand:+ start:36384 stop:36638 length:255 start_codon:yes stop_codon:yes gene_type:complete
MPRWILRKPTSHLKNYLSLAFSATHPADCPHHDPATLGDIIGQNAFSALNAYFQYSKALFFNVIYKSLPICVQFMPLYIAVQHN